MQGTIYLMREAGGLVPMTEQPYNSEALLQKLLAEHPALLAGEQMTEPEPRRWLLVQQEAAIAGSEQSCWYADHLFLDQEGVPTLVEVKRSSDLRIRREVVGQMLDYAAKAVGWTVDEVKARFETTADAEQRLANLIDGGSADEFWEKVRTNLAGGRIRMVFVADEIPAELRRVVDFLASQFSSAEVFAVEVKKFEGGQAQALVPQLVSRPKTTAAAFAARQWDEASFFAALRERSAEDEAVARRLFAWSRRTMTDCWYGKGTTAGSCFPRLFLADGSKLLLFGMWTSGAVEMQFQHMRGTPLERMDVRGEMIERLNRIAGIRIPAEAANRRPSFPMASLRGDEAARAFEEAMEWAIGLAGR